jgi:hypothetical protein
MPSSKRRIPSEVYIRNAIKAEQRGDHELAFRIRLALRVRDLRESKNWSQGELVEKLEKLGPGWNQPKVSDLERADAISWRKKRLWDEEIFQIAKVFEMTDDQFRMGLGRPGNRVSIEGVAAESPVSDIGRLLG